MSDTHSALTPAASPLLDATARASLRLLLNPDSIAVIGASEDSGKFGGRVIEYLLKFGYRGRLIPINPRVATVRGLQAYPSIRSQPHRIDVAVIAAPARYVADAIDECAQSAVRACVLITAEFAEVGDEGARRQAQVVERARAHGIRLLGPNCLGYVNTHGKIALSPSLSLSALDTIEPGGVGLVSQSGALMGSLIAMGTDIGVRFSTCVSVGNQADLELADFIDYMADDATTRLICLYVEGVPSPRRFLQALAHARARGKRVLMVKSGRTESGVRAVKSHTASMAGSYAALRAASEAHGALVMDDVFDMLAVAECLKRHGPLTANGVAVFSASGGAGASLVDSLSDYGLSLASLTEGSIRELAPWLPQTHRHLPVDFGVARLSRQADGASPFGAIEAVLRIVMADPNVHAGVVMLTTGSMMAPIAQAVAAVGRLVDKPLLFVNAAGRAGAQAQAIINAAAHLSFKTSHDAFRVIATLLRDFDQRGSPAPAARRELSLEPVVKTLPQGLLNEHDTKRLLAAAGIPVTRERLARDADEAARIALEIGFPVVLKAQAPSLSHKSDSGGVALDLRSEQAVREAYRAIAFAVESRAGITIEGCLVQEMIEAQAEIIVGTRWDEQFGALVLVGSGGIYVELLRDIRVAAAPISANAAIGLLRSLKSAPILTGFRGRPALALEPIAQAIEAISQLATNLGPRLRELDANPLLVMPQRVVVADARAVLQGAP
ncbi:MAG: acetate--CoA ligase family protein [Burkholderiales bacterium]|nr:acetate--CoA ligase family protein [Burkholderiales bacterium]